MPEETGLHLDYGKVRVDLVPPVHIESVAEVLTYGCQKYAENNWRGGIKYSRVFGSLIRHLLKWYRGIDIDEESGLPHLYHASCNLMFLIYYTNNKMNHLDDRWIE